MMPLASVHEWTRWCEELEVFPPNPSSSSDVLRAYLLMSLDAVVEAHLAAKVSVFPDILVMAVDRLR